MKLEKVINEIYNHVVFSSNDIEKRLSISQEHFKKVYNSEDFPKEEFDQLKKPLALTGPLAVRDENTVWPFLAHKYFNVDNDLVLKLLFILVYKLWNTAMSHFFKRGLDKTLVELTLSSLTQKSYMKKYDTISAVLNVLAEGLVERVDTAIKDKKHQVEIIGTLIVDARNRTRQIVRSFAQKYYELYTRTKKDPSLLPKNTQPAEDLAARYGGHLNVFLAEKPETKKKMVEAFAKKMGIRTIIPYYVVSTLNADDMITFVPLFEKVFSNADINDSNVIYKIAKTAAFEHERNAIYALVESKIKKEQIVKARFDTMAKESQMKVSHVVILALYVYLKQLDKTSANREG